MFPFTDTFPKRPLSFRILHENSVRFIDSPILATCSTHHIFIDLIYLIAFDSEPKHKN
jgi:hypothetical protein